MLEITFFDLVTLTYDKRFNCESAHRQTDRQEGRQTDGIVSLTSTADMGGKNMELTESPDRVIEPTDWTGEAVTDEHTNTQTDLSEIYIDKKL